MDALASLALPKFWRSRCRMEWRFVGGDALIWVPIGTRTQIGASGAVGNSGGMDGLNLEGVVIDGHFSIPSTAH